MVNKKVVEKKPSLDEVAHNLKMCQYYVLGQMDVVWTILEVLYAQASPDEKPLLDEMYDALARYDDIVRRNRGFRYVIPTKRRERR